MIRDARAENHFMTTMEGKIPMGNKVGQKSAARKRSLEADGLITNAADRASWQSTG